MTDLEGTDNKPIFIEFTPKPGVQDVAIYRPDKDLKEKSEKALTEAMGAIEDMAKKINTLHNKIPKEFSEVQVEFGIKFIAETGAFIAKAGCEGSINVTLTWTRPQASSTV
jgi:hypothetical protein